MQKPRDELQAVGEDSATSFLAAKLGELEKKWLEVANELEELQIAAERYKSGEKKAS